MQSAKCRVLWLLAIGYQPFALSPQRAAQFMVPMRPAPAGSQQQHWQRNRMDDPDAPGHGEAAEAGDQPRAWSLRTVHEAATR